jgi:hypothetical protein
VDNVEPIDSLDLNDYGTLDQQVDLITLLQLNSFVGNGLLDLAKHVKTPLGQIHKIGRLRTPTQAVLAPTLDELQ